MTHSVLPEVLTRDGLWRAAFEDSPNETCVLDAHGRVVAANRAWHAFGGENGAKAPIGAGADYLAECDRAAARGCPEAATFARAIRAVLAGEESCHRLEYPCHTPLQERWFIGRVAPMVYGGGRYALVDHCDVTCRRLAEEGLRQAYDQLLELDQAKANFVSMVSHELRTPLTVILGSLEELDEDMPEARPDLAPLVHVSLSSAKRLRTMVEDLLDFAHLGGSRFSLRLRRVELVGLMHTLLAPLAVEARRAGLSWRLALPEPPLHASVDADRLEQVLSNLIRNAIKFTPAGGAIGVALAREGETARIEVTDTGVGLPPAEVERLFLPFIQGDAGLTRRYGGVGLGLAIAKSLVESHGGRIGAEPLPGAGARFWFTLPLA